jgi:hypothetical protein
MPTWDYINNCYQSGPEDTDGPFVCETCGESHDLLEAPGPLPECPYCPAGVCWACADSHIDSHPQADIDAYAGEGR